MSAATGLVSGKGDDMKRTGGLPASLIADVGEPWN